MPIPCDPNPLGEGWHVIPKKAFMVSTWQEGEFVPLGLPNGGRFETRRCTRAGDYGLLYYGYDNLCSTPSFSFQYTNRRTPPRTTVTNAAPAIEFRQDEVRRLGVVLKLERALVEACATDDDWATWWNLVIVDLGDGAVFIDSVRPCMSLEATSTWGRL